MVGKRKRDASVVSRSTTVDEEEAPPATTDASAHDVFRRFFEAQFLPVELPGGTIPHDTDGAEEKEDEEESGESDSGTEWGGFSEPEDEGNEVEVVEHTDSSNKTDDVVDKKARKAFMVCTYYK